MIDDPTLADLAPSILRLFGVEPPAAMTGARLFDHGPAPGRVLLAVLDGWGLSASCKSDHVCVETPIAPLCWPIPAKLAERVCRV